MGTLIGFPEQLLFLTVLKLFWEVLIKFQTLPDALVVTAAFCFGNTHDYITDEDTKDLILCKIVSIYIGFFPLG